MKGVFPFRRMDRDSSVWGSRPCIMSTTRMAMSHIEEPRTRKLLEVGEEEREVGEEAREEGRRGADSKEVQSYSLELSSWKVDSKFNICWLLPERLVARCVYDQ